MWLTTLIPVADLTAAQERTLINSVLYGRGALLPQTQTATLNALMAHGLVKGYPPLVTFKGYLEAARRGVISAPHLRYYLDHARDDLAEAWNEFAPPSRRGIALIRACLYLYWVGLICRDVPHVNLEALRLIARGSLYYNPAEFYELERAGLIQQTSYSHSNAYLTEAGAAYALTHGLIESATYKSKERAQIGDRVRVGGYWRHIIAIRAGEVRGEYYAPKQGGIVAVWLPAAQCQLIGRYNPLETALDCKGQRLFSGARARLLSREYQPTVEVVAIWQEYAHIRGYGINDIILASNLEEID